MAVPDFYNWNAKRKYPLVSPATGVYRIGNPAYETLPDGALLDCGFVLSSAYNFDPAQDHVYLHGIKKTGDDLAFVFHASSGVGTFEFTRDKSSVWGATEFVAADGNPARGTGFLVTGRLLDLWSVLLEGYNDMDVLEIAKVEPATVVSQRGHNVQSVTVANKPKISGSRCCDPATASPDDVQIVAAGLVGNVKLKAGYNMAIYADSTDNSMVFTPGIGDGMGEVCNEFFQTGIPKCGDLVYSFNNVPPSANGVFGLTGSNGIVVTAFPEQHKIVIHGDIRETVYCGS